MKKKMVAQDEEGDGPSSSTMLFEVVDHGMVLLESIEEDEDELSEGSLFSIDIDNHDRHLGDNDHDHDGRGEDDHSDGVYVAVGKSNSKSSMEALLWTLKHAISSPSSAIVYLIHVFPVIRLIPSPCKFFRNFWRSSFVICLSVAFNMKKCLTSKVKTG